MNIIQHNTSTSFIYNEHAFLKLRIKFMRKQCLHDHAALILEGRVQDPILRASWTKVGRKTSRFVSQWHATNRIDEPLLSPNFLSSWKALVYLMNNRCVLWSLREHAHMNIGYKNGLPHQTTDCLLNLTLRYQMKNSAQYTIPRVLTMMHTLMYVWWYRK